MEAAAAVTTMAAATDTADIMTTGTAATGTAAMMAREAGATCRTITLRGRAVMAMGMGAITATMITGTTVSAFFLWEGGSGRIAGLLLCQGSTEMADSAHLNILWRMSSDVRSCYVCVCV